MKDSDSTWVGKIPNQWDFTPIKFFAKLSQEKSDIIPEGKPYIALEHIESGTGVFEVDTDIEEIGSSVSLFSRNDVLFGKLRPYLAKVIRPQFDGCCSSELIILKSSTKVDSLFLKYLLLSSVFIDHINATTYGVKMPRASPDSFGSIKIPHPQLSEQKIIGQFLEKENKKINYAISTTKEMIQSLLERRSSLITQAITKGLNSNVPMKDSGVEWIGKIPEHWEIIPLKRDFEVQLGKMLQNEPKSDTDTHEYYLKSANVQWDGVSLTPQVKMWFSESEKEKYLLKKGDLLVSEGGDVGRSCLYNDEYERCYIQNAINRVRSSHKVSTEYLYYFMKAMHHSGFVEIICNKSTIPHFTAEKVAEVRYTRPPINEISQIVESLNGVCKQIEESITLVENNIIKLKEYRKALISAAVTGKIDVRSL
jgi:type I restriction enzyme S subunit